MIKPVIRPAKIFANTEDSNSSSMMYNAFEIHIDIMENARIKIANQKDGIEAIVLNFNKVLCIFLFIYSSPCKSVISFCSACDDIRLDIFIIF
jgi:hypothetical protein